MRNRHAVSDATWSRVRHFFRRRSRWGRPPRDPRTVLDGVLWILGTGAPWRDLPLSFGPWQTVYGHFRRWVVDGRLSRILARLRRFLARPRRGDRLWCVDSTVVRAARSAGGARRARSPGEPGDHALGRSRGGFGTKLSLVCDGLGVPLAAVVGPGQQHDLKQVVAVVERAAGVGERPLQIAGDKAYSAPWLRAWFRTHGIQPVIPTRRDQAREPDFAPRVYRRRNVVERLIGWLKESRRVATRYDKLATSYLAFVQLAFMRRLLRLLEFSDKP